MIVRLGLVLLFLLMGSQTLIGCGGSEVETPTDVNVVAQVRDVHESLFVMDMHVDSMLHAKLYGTDFSVAHRPPRGLEYLYLPQADLPNLMAGGTDAVRLAWQLIPHS